MRRLDDDMSQVMSSLMSLVSLSLHAQYIIN
jgi:hypothetical protein